MRRSRPTLATWLALVAFLLSGLAPAQALVVCVEADGSVSLEDAAGRCAPCAPGETRSAAQAGDEGCPCVDIPLPVASDEHPAGRTALDPPARAGAIAPHALVRLASGLPDLARALARVAPPRPPGDLALLRTVLLRL